MKKCRVTGLTYQRFSGIALIIVGLIAMVIASSAHTPADMDATVSVFAIPLGVWLFTTKKRVMNK